MSKLSKAIRKAANQLGYDVIKKMDPSDAIGTNPILDIRRNLPSAEKDLVVFDIGANTGNTTLEYKEAFPDATIHAFEPGPETFKKLKKATSALEGVHLWNCGMGASPAELPFFENSHHDMSSFLPLSTCGWGEVEKETRVPVRTVDEFCETEGIERIDVLKTDTQGFELEVFKGAERMMREDRIRFVFFEVIFSDMYKNLPEPHELFRFLADHDFLLVTFYPFGYGFNVASWTDALFMQRNLHPQFKA